MAGGGYLGYHLSRKYDATNGFLAEQFGAFSKMPSWAYGQLTPAELGALALRGVPVPAASAAPLIVAALFSLALDGSPAPVPAPPVPARRLGAARRSHRRVPRGLRPPGGGGGGGVPGGEEDGARVMPPDPGEAPEQGAARLRRAARRGWAVQLWMATQRCLVGSPTAVDRRWARCRLIGAGRSSGARVGVCVVPRVGTAAVADVHAD